MRIYNWYDMQIASSLICICHYMHFFINTLRCEELYLMIIYYYYSLVATTTFLIDN